jgi:hypothetical protein
LNQRPQFLDLPFYRFDSLQQFRLRRRRGDRAKLKLRLQRAVVRVGRDVPTIVRCLQETEVNVSGRVAEFTKTKSSMLSKFGLHWHLISVAGRSQAQASPDVILSKLTSCYCSPLVTLQSKL